MRSLETLHLGHTDLTIRDGQEAGFVGTIPESLGNLTNLKVFEIDNHPLTGSFPRSFKNLVNLEAFIVRTRMHEPIPSEEILKDMTRLKELRIQWMYDNVRWDDTPYSDTIRIPESIGNLSSLEGLSLHNMPTQGTVRTVHRRRDNHSSFEIIRTQKNRYQFRSVH